VGEELKRCGKCSFFDAGRERCLNYNMKVTRTSLVDCDAFQLATEEEHIQKPVPLPESPKSITAAPSFLSILSETKPIEGPSTQIIGDKPTPPMKKSIFDEIKDLHKEVLRIPLQISNVKAYNIVNQQILALDLTRIGTKKGKLIAYYTGITKITGNDIKISNEALDNEIIITAWSEEKTQAEGFLSYFKLLITNAFESVEKYEEKTRKLNQIVTDSSGVIKIILTLSEQFEKEWVIGEILFLLKEIKAKIIKKFPGLFVIEKLGRWIVELDAQYGDGSIIPERVIMDLEFQILEWVFEINKTSFNNIEVYLQTFPEMKDQIQVLYNLLEDNFPIFADLEKRYLKLILNYLIVTEKSSGLTLYNYNFTPLDVDTALFSGFLNAIQNFGSEIYSETTVMTRLSYKTFEILLDDEEAIIAALILRGNPTENTTQRLRIFTKEFSKKFQKEIMLWGGNAKLFNPADDLIRMVFG